MHTTYSKVYVGDIYLMHFQFMVG